MADKKFTLLELHLNGDVAFSPSVSNSAPAIGSKGADGAGEVAEDEEEPDEELDIEGGDADGNSRGLVLLGVFVLVVLLAAIARVLRGGDADLDELAELDDLADDLADNE